MTSRQLLCAEFLVKGKVQGVFFRDSTKRYADSIGVVGTVENLADKTLVRCVACGTSGELAQLEHFLKRGPPNAQVHSVEKTDIAVPVEPFEGFAIVKHHHR